MKLWIHITIFFPEKNMKIPILLCAQKNSYVFKRTKEKWKEEGGEKNNGIALKIISS